MGPMPIVPALRLKQENGNFWASLNYGGTPCLKEKEKRKEVQSLSPWAAEAAQRLGGLAALSEDQVQSLALPWQLTTV